MNLNVPQLRALVALARLGTMVAVAEELGYTPGAVSQQIAALEKSVSTPLISKAGRRVILTDAGLVLAEHAEHISGAEQAAIDAVLRLRDARSRSGAPWCIWQYRRRTSAGGRG